MDGVQTDLGILSHLELTPLDVPDPELSYLFKHIITQQVAYESLLYATRSMLHEQIGLYIERTYTDNLDQYVNLLAFHYEHSTNEDKKRHYLLMAGEAARKAYANAGAIYYFEKALPLLTDRPRIDIRLKLGKVLELTGAWDEAESQAQAALAESQDLADQDGVAWAQTALGELARKRNHYDDAAEWFAQARSTFESLDNQAGIGQVLHYSGTLAAQQGDNVLANQRYGESLAIRRALGDRENEANVLNNLGIVSRYLGNLDGARGYHEAALAIQEELGNRWTTGALLNNLGHMAIDRGEFAYARTQLEKALLIWREIGERWATTNTIHNLANVARDEGNPADALTLYADSVAGWQDLNDRWGLAYWLEDMGLFHLKNGDPRLALALDGNALALRESIQVPRPPSYAEKLADQLAPARQALGDEAPLAQEAGRALSLSDAISHALRQPARCMIMPDRQRTALYALFNIKQSEGRVVGLLLLHSLFNGGAISLSCSAAFALFLTAHGAEQLPWAYILAAGMIALTGYVHRSLEHRFAFGPLFMGLLAFLVLTLGGIWIGFRLAPAGWLAFAGLIWFQVAYTLMGLEFWGVAGRLLTLQQGKRLFGLIGAGNGLANVLGYALVPVLVGWMGTVNLLALAVASLLGSLVTLYLLTPYTREPALARPAIPRRAAKPEGVPVPPMRLPYVQWIAAAHLLGLVLYGLLEFGFMQQVDAYYPDADALAAFLGIVGAFAYGGGLLLQAFGSGRLLQRFGLRFGILSLPVGVLLPLAAAALGGSLGSAPWLFWGVVVAYALNDLLLGGLFGPSFKLLYQPLDRRTRLLAQSLVESVFEPVGIALAGVALLGLQMVTDFTVVGLTYLLILLAGVWIAATVWAYRGYLATLKQSLTARLLDGVSLEIKDAVSLATVQAKLESHHPGEVVYALELLQQADVPLTESQLTRLLAHDEPLVRSAVLAGLAGPLSGDLLDRVQSMVAGDPSVDVRGAAMQSWARLEPTETVRALLPYVTEAEGSLREAAMVAMLRYGGIAGVLATGGQLLQMVESSRPADRVTAAHVLGKVASNGFYQPLLQLLADEDAAVDAGRPAGRGHGQQPPFVARPVDRPGVAQAGPSRGHGPDPIRGWHAAHH